MSVRIPTFADLPTNDPHLTGRLPQYPAEDPVAVAQGQFGKGVTAVGGALLGMAEDRRQKQNQLNAALAEADLDGNLIRFNEQAKHETDRGKLDEMKAGLPGQLERAAATITDPEARQLWMAKHRIKINAAEAVADTQHRKIYNDQFLAGAGQQLDEQARLAAQTSEPALQEQAKRNIGNVLGSLESSGIISASKAQELGRNYGEKVIIGTVNWLDANGDPVGAARYLRENLQHIDPDKAESLTRHLRPMVDREIGRAAKERHRTGAPGGAGMSVGGAIPSRVAEEAGQQNFDQKTALATAHIESSMGRNLGSRGNIFQLGKNEWATIGGGSMGEPGTDIKNGVAWLAKTQSEMAERLGRKPEGWETYLGHQQGVAGASKLLGSPNTPAGQLVPPEHIRANGGDPNAPASAFIGHWRDKFNRTADSIGGVAPADTVETAGKPVAIGDSIAAHLIRKAGVGGTEYNDAYKADSTAVSGASPAVVLGTINKTPEANIKGRDILLSTGVSNNPAQIDMVPDQIKALKARGAANVTVLGVGTADRVKGANDQLSQIAADNGATFAGPMRKVAGDGIHSSDPKDLLAQAQAVRPKAGPASSVINEDTDPALAAQIQAAPAAGEPIPLDRIGVPVAPAGQLEAGNIDPAKRPVVKNPDGKISTVYSMSFNEDGKEVLIPTVSADGSGVLSDEDAIAQYRKTGQFLGKFDTPDNATAYAKALSHAQARQYGRSSAAMPASQPGVPDIRAWVDRIKADRSLTEEQKDIAIREVQQDQQQTMLGHAQAESDLALRIARGEAGRADIEDAYQKQWISPEKRTQYNHAIDKMEEQQNAVAQAVAKVSAAGAGGAPLDPKSKDDRAALNYHYDAVSKAWPADEVVDRGLAYSAQYNMVPTAIQARIRGGLHSGRPELAIEAARTINRLRNANPQLVGEIGDENDLRLAASISARDSMGVPPERALQMAVDEMKVPKVEKEARLEEYEARGKTDIERRASDTQWIEKQQNSFWVNDPNVDPQMRREFEEVAKTEFQKTGNLEAARRMSLDNINRVWGRSSVGGDNRYMKNAPEKFYGVPTLSSGENADWMNEQLLGDLSKNALQDPSNPITVDRLKLFPDSTRGEGRPPLYQVWVLGANSVMTMQIKPNGAPYLWRPDWASSAEFKRRQEGRVRSIDEARQLRNPTLAPAQMLGTEAGRLLEDVR